MESFTAHAHFLHSPYELSGDIIDTIFEQMLVKNQNVELDVDLDKLPVISPESMRKVHNDMVDVHSSCLQRWLGEYLTGIDLNKLPVISPESLRKVHNDLLDTQASCLQRWLGEYLPIAEDFQRVHCVFCPKLVTVNEANKLRVTFVRNV